MKNYLPVFRSPEGEAAFNSAYRAVLERWSAPYTEEWIEIASAKKLFPALETEIVQSAHHIAALANPERVNRLILDFLERLPDIQVGMGFKSETGS